MEELTALLSRLKAIVAEIEAVIGNQPKKKYSKEEKLAMTPEDRAKVDEEEVMEKNPEDKKEKKEEE